VVNERSLASADGRASPAEDRASTIEGRASLAGSAVATGRGDDGTTGLLFGGARVPKDDPRIEACGTVDEAVAAIGLARAELVFTRRDGVLPPQLADMADLLLRLQRELFVAGAELAANPAALDRLVDGTTRVSDAMVESLGATLVSVEAALELPREFVVPGATRLSAALELSRTVVRRAERRSAAVLRTNEEAGSRLIPYLNRLADLLWVLSRAAEAGESQVPIPARTGHASNGRPPREQT
jgi:cob(I)alamin adenosyltransferase